MANTRKKKKPSQAKKADQPYVKLPRWSTYFMIACIIFMLAILLGVIVGK